LPVTNAMALPVGDHVAYAVFGGMRRWYDRTRSSLRNVVDVVISKARMSPLLNLVSEPVVTGNTEMTPLNEMF
jgi:hypothetical protein